MGFAREPETFGRCLLRLRDARGMSQKALALAAHMDQSYVAGLETGRRPVPRERQVFRLAGALDATENELAELLAARSWPVSRSASGMLGILQRPGFGHLLVTLSMLNQSEVVALDAIAQLLARRTWHSELLPGKERP